MSEAAADARWAAVTGRDRSADGRFVYSVSTTGVFCRPSCGARRPLPTHVRFHASVEAALRAGFRPCRRCRPEADPADRGHGAAIARVCRHIEQAEGIPPLGELAAIAGLSAHHFHRLFKAATGLTPRGYAEARRDTRVREALTRRPTVTDAMYEAGFNSGGRFYEHAADALGMRPRDYRTGAPGIEIRFAVAQSSLGAVLVAATPRGVCAVLLGDDPDGLVRDLQDRFPRATFVGGDAEFEQTVAEVVGLVEAPGRSSDLPLDVRGTAFQQRVWQALRQVPAGRTVSYRELAARIGAPAAVRAVAAACAANPVAVAIPCHRVVRQDGGLSGYRWGVERKRQLLEREGSA